MSRSTKMVSTKVFDEVGGSAFPAAWDLPEGGRLTCPGMTLRDWFAGQALVAIIQADGIQFAETHRKGHANLAYMQADAMLTAREATP